MSHTNITLIEFSICSPAARRVRAAVKEPQLNNEEERLRRAEALLEEWYAWSATYRPALGIPGCSPSSRQAQSSKQWQSTTEIADESLRKDEMEAVEWCIDVLRVEYRQVIGIEMRNRASGRRVWRPHRLSEVSYAEALEAILPIMQRKGVL